MDTKAPNKTLAELPVNPINPEKLVFISVMEIRVELFWSLLGQKFLKHYKGLFKKKKKKR